MMYSCQFDEMCIVLQVISCRYEHKNCCKNGAQQIYLSQLIKSILLLKGRIVSLYKIKECHSGLYSVLITDHLVVLILLLYLHFLLPFSLL